ncbi:MAG: CbiX/SirB N-terminal domain-containing protein [Corynebacterium sp.]|uniref:sirohydrochlorin chelatase n=1 Tax=Corynebacterium sp. TaxID=1720 RepID=UPI0026DCFA9F|nr:CbiX/SirB N-terminal domain-containing protein [Corynebacterium sp.]MDO5029828.1 CbiX/SirB N-terminal domain-containing protein [Corynebacterium sp.]
MTALILLAHGSRHPGTKPVLQALVDQVRSSLPTAGLHAPSQVRLAWLDLDEPSLDQVCSDLAAAGEPRAVAVPLLFTGAYHSRIDVPDQVRACNRHGIDITVAGGLGLGDGTKRAVVKRIIGAAEDAAFAGTFDALVMAVGSSDVAANAAVHSFAASLDGMLPGHVSAAFVVGPEEVKGAAAVAAAHQQARQRGRGLVVVPLFTAPGLLWDRVTDAGSAAEQVAYGEPLSDLLAPIVCCRWDSRAAYASVPAAVA